MDGVITDMQFYSQLHHHMRSPTNLYNNISLSLISRSNSTLNYVYHNFTEPTYMYKNLFDLA